MLICISKMFPRKIFHLFSSQIFDFVIQHPRVETAALLNFFHPRGLALTADCGLVKYRKSPQ